MTTWDERARRLQYRINITSLPTVPADRGVVTVWPEPDQLAILKGWNKISDDLWYQDGGAIREWVLEKDTERLALKLFVSSQGAENARLFLVRQALSPSAEDPPYERRVEGEALSLFLHLPEVDSSLNNDSMLLIYRNVVIDVRSFSSSVSVRQVAESLLRIASEHGNLPLSENLPNLEGPSVSSFLLGELVNVYLPSEPDLFGQFDETPFQVQIAIHGDLEFVGFHKSTAQFRTRSAGEGKLRVQAIDRGTLLSREVQADLHIIPPAKAD